MVNNTIINTSYNRLCSFIDKQTQKSEDTGEIYLTAGGYYQESYIAIFEELTSSNILDLKNNIDEEYVDFIAELFVKELLKKYPNKHFPFNKIVSVTLPSQMIAKAIHKNLKKYNDIYYYTNTLNCQDTNNLPKLIRLASYYSFFEEIQFKNILPKDKVLVVNDVISTGNLLKDIEDSISSIKIEDDAKTEARISCVLSVVDSRVPDSEIEISKHRKSNYFNSTDGLNENEFITLESKRILKFKENPDTSKKLVRINPILNARVTLESRHSEEDKIIFNNANYFLNYIPSKAMAIGHFTENSLHHQYFFKPEILFNSEYSDFESSGIKLVRDIYRKIISKEEKYDVNFAIKSITTHLNTLEDIINENPNIQGLNTNKLKIELSRFVKKSIKISNYKKSHHSKKSKLLDKDDFIFYPVFSGVESDELIDELHSIFGVNYSNVKPLQRFDTNKGWRFIVPQKSYNSRLKGKKIIILDMGSFTGDSIIQMIDSLCVFELKKIIVISLIGRLEDFNREFFSRIREMKVKTLNSNNNTNILAPFNQNSLTPINIYFGANLHFPASRSTKVCEHCKEINILNSYLKFKEFNTTNAKIYISHRLKVVDVKHVNEIDSLCPDYFPILRNKTIENDYDILTFFTLRDHLGKIDGYRFYTDYYKFFDDLIEDSVDYKRNIEAIISITLHEKHLTKTIENQLPDVKKKIKSFLDDLIDLDIQVDDLFYEWKILSILEAYFLYNRPCNIFQKENFLNLLEFLRLKCSKDSLEFYYIEFKIAEAYLLNKSNKSYNQSNLIKTIKEIWHEIEDNTSIPYHHIIVKFNRIILNDTLVEGSNQVRSFFNIFNMYNSASGYKPSHTDFGRSLDDLKAVIVAQNIDHGMESGIFISHFKKEYKEVKLSLNDLLNNITEACNYINSLNKLFEFKKFHSTYFEGEKSLQSYLDKIDIILNKPDSNNHLIELQDALIEVQNEYFNISSSEINFYTIWKESFYISLLTIWKCFINQEEVHFFNEYIDNRNYHELIKTNLKSFDISVGENYSNVGVNIHPFFLIKICKELLDNAFKYAGGSDVKICFDQIFSKNKETLYSRFVFVQNANAKGRPAKGLETVEKIITDFRGTFMFNDSESNVLEIEIKIPTTKYKIKSYV